MSTAKSVKSLKGFDQLRKQIDADPSASGECGGAQGGDAWRTTSQA